MKRKTQKNVGLAPGLARREGILARWAAVFLVAGAVASDWYSLDVPERIGVAGSALDRLEKHLSEWGHASISSFVMVPERSGVASNYFDLNYERPTSEYADRIRTGVQGEATFLDQRESQFALKARAANAGIGSDGSSSLTPAQLEAAGRQDQIAALADQIRVAQLQRELARITNATEGWQTNQLTLPTNAAASVATSVTNPSPVLPETSLNQSGGVISNGFAAFGQLQTNRNPAQLSEATVLKLAASAKETERVLNFMSHPVNLPGDRQAFFAIGQISVMPGWRTKQDYYCEVSARFTCRSPYPDFKRALMDDQGTNSAALQRLVNRECVDRESDIQSIDRLVSGLQIPAASSSLVGGELLNQALGELATLRNGLNPQYTNRTATLTETNLYRSWVSVSGALDRYVRNSPKERAQLAPLRRELDRQMSQFEYRDSEVYMVYPDSEVGRIAGWRNPSISLVSAFPFAEAQVFDLQSSIRRQSSFLLSLAGTYLQAGFKAEAELLLKQVRKIEKDLATRNALPTVIPGVDANTLTYRFDPEATAMLDPTQTKPKAGHQLLPTTIPVLVLVVIDKADLARWSQMAVEVETRWIPKSKRPFLPMIFADYVANQRLRDKALPHSKSLELAEDFDTVRSILTRGGFGPNGLQVREIRRRFDILQEIGFGRTASTELPGREPQAMAVQIDDAAGQMVKAAKSGEPATFHMRGRNLDSRPRLALGGIPLELVPGSATPTTLSARFGGGDARVPLGAGLYDLEVQTTRGAFVLPKAVKVEETGADTKCEGRLPIVIESVQPSNGILNGRTVFVATGRNFRPPGRDDEVKFVLVGGRMAENVAVISDRVLRFEIPGWSNDNPYTNQTNLASVVAVSSCAASQGDKGVYFGITVPEPKSGGANANPELSKQVELFKQIQGMTNQATKFSASMRLEAGVPAGTNTPATGPGSTVINVQAGQNTNGKP